jgi:hypothetical protein
LLWDTGIFRSTQSSCVTRSQSLKLAALQAAITLGVESGEAGKLDMGAIKRKARELAKLQDA